MKKILTTILLSLSFLMVNAEESTDNEKTKDFSSSWFMINVSWENWLLPNTNVNFWNAETTDQRVNWLLWTIIQKLMVALWVLSVLIMTIWAWYMILNFWQDSFIDKWKKIFLSWVTAMVVSLSSYYIVSLVRFLLYN